MNAKEMTLALINTDNTYRLIENNLISNNPSLATLVKTLNYIFTDTIKNWGDSFSHYLLKERGEFWSLISHYDGNKKQFFMARDDKQREIIKTLFNAGDNFYKVYNELSIKKIIPIGSSFVYTFSSFENTEKINLFPVHLKKGRIADPKELDGIVFYHAQKRLNVLKKKGLQNLECYQDK